MNAEDPVPLASGVVARGQVAVDQVLRLLGNVPKVSKDVALKVAEQLPEVRKIATKALGGLERAHQRTVEANAASQEHVHRAYQDVRDVLKGELREEDLTWDQKKEIYDLLMRTVDEGDAAKDSENKRALTAWLTAAGVVAVAGLAVCVALLGAAQASDGPDSQQI